MLNGTVASPDDAAQAQRLVAGLNPGMSTMQVRSSIVPVSRLKVATPLQVKLKVRIAEVNRSLLKQFGVNLLSRDTTGGFRSASARATPARSNVRAARPTSDTG